MFDLLISKAFARTPPALPTFETIPGIIGWLNIILDWGFRFFAVLAVGMLLYAAFLFLFSQGNDDKIKTARQMLIYSFIAIILATLARTIPALLEHTIRLGS